MSKLLNTPNNVYVYQNIWGSVSIIFKEILIFVSFCAAENIVQKS